MVRLKERYLLVNILYPDSLARDDDINNPPDLVVLHQPTTDKLSPQALLSAIRSEITGLFGDYGAGAMTAGGLSVKYLSAATSTFILRISRSHYRLVWAALSVMESVPVRDGKPCVFRVVHVSGAIRRVEEEAVRRARDIVMALKNHGEVKGQPGALDAMLGGNAPKRSRSRSRGIAVGDVDVDVDVDIDVEDGEDEEDEEDEEDLQRDEAMHDCSGGEDND